MEQLVKNSYSKIIATIFCFAMMLCSVPAHSQKNDKRCYVVDGWPSKLKTIKHCYSDKDHPVKYSIVDIPVSLAEGTVRTPEFSPPKSGWHWIMIQVEKPLPFYQEGCMMGALSSCSSDHPLLQADWTAWQDGQVVLSGSSKPGVDMYWNDFMFKFIGDFPALVGKKYVVEVKFTKDGTPLNVANPHLIIVRNGDE
jgi:hypothetical protein